MSDKQSSSEHQSRWLKILVIDVIAVVAIVGVFLWTSVRVYDSEYPLGEVVRMDVVQISNAISHFVRDRDRLPAKWNELTERDSTGRPYLDFANPPPLDPWRRPYIYEPDFARRTWLVESLGRDGELGGSGDDADIICEGSIDGVKSLTNPNELPRTSKR